MNDLTEYLKYREQMKTGDLLTYRTDGAISWAIRRWSPGANHAGMVLDLDEFSGETCRRWTLEATAHGPRMAFLSTLLENLHGECYWHQLKPEFSEANRNAAGCWALEQQGVVKYDFKGILEYPFKLVSADMARLFCSEYVEFSWVKGKIIPFVEQAAAYKPSELPTLGVTLPPVLIVRREEKNHEPAQIVSP
jgi:hypothetical protein